MNPSRIAKLFSISHILFSIVFGIWIPLQCVLFSVDTNWDIAMDVLGLLYLGTHLLYHYKLDQKLKWNLTTVLISFPLFTLIQMLTGESYTYLLLFKLISLVNLKQIGQLFHDMDNLHPIVARIAPLSLMVPLMVHVMACGWIWVEDLPQNSGTPLLFVYGRAVYWTVTTLCTVGYGDIAAKTLPQMAFANFVMVIGVAFFGYVLSNVASLLSRLDGARESYMSHLDRVENYMRYNNIPADLRIKVREYLRYLWESRKGYEDEEALHSLPYSLRSELSLFINRSVIEKVPLLKGASEEMVREIVMQLQSVVCTPGDFIFRLGEPGDKMYFIQKGQVEIVSGEGQVLVTLPAGSFFGEMALLTSNPRNASARAVHYCDLFTLSREAFTYTLSHYPDFEKQVHKIVEERQNPRVAKVS